jgi:hypothetical protein
MNVVLFNDFTTGGTLLINGQGVAMNVNGSVATGSKVLGHWFGLFSEFHKVVVVAVAVFCSKSAFCLELSIGRKLNLRII